MAEGDGLRRCRWVSRASRRRRASRRGRSARGQLASAVMSSIAPRPTGGNRRDLIVARAAGEPAGRFADQILKARPHVHVDVFERGSEREGARLDLFGDAVEALARYRRRTSTERGSSAAPAWPRGLASLRYLPSRAAGRSRSRRLSAHDRGGPAAKRPPHIWLAPDHVSFGWPVWRVSCPSRAICPRLPPTCDGRVRPGQGGWAQVGTTGDEQNPPDCDRRGPGGHRHRRVIMGPAAAGAAVSAAAR